MEENSQELIDNQEENLISEEVNNEAAPAEESAVSDDLYGIGGENKGAQPTAKVEEEKKERLFNQDEVNTIINQQLERLDKHFEERFGKIEKPEENLKQEQAIDDSSLTEVQRLEKTLEVLAAKKLQEEQRRQVENERLEAQKKLSDNIRTAQQTYKDYEDVVINNSMINNDKVFLEAASYTDDPGRFLYAACKNHAETIKTISQIKNPVEKLKAVLKLENELKVGTRAKNNAPQPMSSDGGYSTQTNNESYSDFDAYYSNHPTQVR